MSTTRAVRSSRVRRALGGGLTSLLLLFVSTLSAAAQQVPLERGVTGTALDLRRLDGVKRVLMIGAHPDDEDTSLLTTLSRGMGVETAYLALTRGDGGQNLIGPELFEGLGVVRTGELLAARKLDGGRQFFTRAFDYGFSKSADEALSFWPEEKLLRDVVWVVRKFRPQVIVSVFSGTPADGHGQHQAAGIVAQEVFSAAADPTKYPEQLSMGVETWQASKLYRLNRRVEGPPPITMETGTWDPVLGRSYFQLAMESRSQHRSQDMGQSQPLGPRASSLVLINKAPDVDVSTDAAFFAGVDTTLAGLADDLTPAAGRAVLGDAEGYREELTRAEGMLSATDPEAVVPALAEARAHLVSALAATATDPEGGDVRTVLSHRLQELDETMVAAAGVVIRARVDDGLVVPGDTVNVMVEVWNGGGLDMADVKPGLDLPRGWRVADVTAAADDGRDNGFFGRSPSASLSDDGGVPAGQVARWRFAVSVPPDADLSRLYYRLRPRDGEMYQWPQDRPDLWALPKDPAPMHAHVTFRLGDGTGGLLSVEREARYIGVDKATGEYSEPVLVVPTVSVAASPASMAWPAGMKETREITVELRGEARASGSVRLDAPTGWQVEPASVPFRFDEPGQSRTVAFHVTPDGVSQGRSSFQAVATLDDGRTYAEGYSLIDYPHIERTAFFEPAVANVTVVPVKIADGLKVGYIMGSGDDGVEALRQLGVDVEVLGPERVRSGDFQGLDALVLGIRAYETRPDLVAANDQVLAFARAGGSVLVQYNKYEFPNGDFAPYPVSMGRGAPRVTDEHSPVKMLDPNSPVFSTPNRITQEDFQGWVQERGLYFLAEWDDHFMPQLELTDPGEDPTDGSILVAPVGDGLYTYAALSFFRQFPAGVAGAYRLFANLVSLNADTWHRYLESIGRPISQ